MAGSEPGRRDNGLASADWGALVDLDPRLSSTLLERLAQAGVAAYVEPAGGVDTVHRGVTLPDRPLDRLWVDPARAEAARTVVTALTSELDGQELVREVPRGSARRVLAPPRLTQAPAPADDDEVFRQIVAGFASDGDSPVPSWPVQEDLGLSTTPDSGAPESPAPRRRREDAELPGWVEPDAIEPEEDDHYVPPPPPPLRRFRASTVGYLVAIVAGVLLLFAPNLLGLVAGDDTRTLGMVALTAGAGALIWSMHERPEDPDDGAVV